jgi:hypothetical protein
LGLVLEPVYVVLAAVNSSALAIIARSLAICRTGTEPLGRHGAIRGRRGTVRGGTLTVPGPASRDLPARTIHPRSVARRQLTVAFGGDLVALGSRSIAAVSTRIATSGRGSTPRDAPAAFLRAAVACIAHQVMNATVATRHEIAIACPLVHGRGMLVLLGRSLVGIGRGLLAVTPRLLVIRESLLTIGAPLIAA